MDGSCTPTLRAADGRESLLADPGDVQAATGKPPAINGFEASPDGQFFPCIRGPQVAGDAAMSGHLQNRRAYLHVVGTDPAQDGLWLGFDADPRVTRCTASRETVR